MEVIVDGQRNFKCTGTPETVLELIREISDFLHEQGRDIVSVVCDGRSVSPERIIGEFENLSPASVRRLEIGSEDTSSMVNTCLSELVSTLPELPAACRNLAEIFHGESPEDGFEPFEKLADIWSHIKTRELLVANALRLDLSQYHVNGLPVNTLPEQLNSFLEEAAQALRNGDCVLLGDLLEYELAPRAEQEAAIVALLQEHAPAKP